MKIIGYVEGSATCAVPLVVGVDTVYVHTDIKKVVKLDDQGKPVENLYSYHEVQYGKDEYIQLMAEKMDDSDVLRDRVLMLEEKLIEKAVISETDRSDLERGRPPIAEEPKKEINGG